MNSSYLGYCPSRFNDKTHPNLPEFIPIWQNEITWLLFITRWPSGKFMSQSLKVIEHPKKNIVSSFTQPSCCSKPLRLVLFWGMLVTEQFLLPLTSIVWTKTLRHFSKCLLACFTEERMSYRFRNCMSVSKRRQNLDFWVNYQFKNMRWVLGLNMSLLLHQTPLLSDVLTVDFSLSYRRLHICIH